MKSGISRGPHRSTILNVRIDISGLMDENGRPMMKDEELEQVLRDLVWEQVRQVLERGRDTVRGHP